MDFRLIVPRSVSLEHCPKCGKLGSLDRVRSDGIYDKLLLKIFKIRSYHCRKCKWAGKFFLYKIRNKPGVVILNYAIIAVFFLVFLIILNKFIK